MPRAVALLCAVLLSAACAAEPTESVTEQLYLTTVRLELYFRDASRPSGYLNGLGTGFFYRPTEDPNLLWIVTNKHVLKHTDLGLVNHVDCIFHESTWLRPPDVLWTKKLSWASPKDPAAPGSALFHPLPHIDIAAIPFVWPDGGPGWRPIENGTSRPIMLKKFEPQHVLTNDDLYDNVVGGDNVLMYGYPHYLIDVYHNLPVVRSGYLASLAYIDYSPSFQLEVCGGCAPTPPMPMGAVDMACFSGSSGSPVVLVDGANARLTREGNSHFGKRRIILLGVAWGTIFRKVTDQIMNIPITGDIQEDLHITFYWKATEIAKLGTSPTPAAVNRKKDSDTGKKDEL